MIKKLASKVIFRNKWMVVRNDEVEFPSGVKGAYGVVEKDDFVLVVPYQDGKVFLVNNYRYPIQAQSWELPAGALEDNPQANPSEVAAAELKQETGLVANKLEPLGKLYEANGYCTQAFTVVLATDLTQTEPEHEDTEVITDSKWVTITEFKKMLINGEMRDAPSISGFMLAESLGKL